MKIAVIGTGAMGSVYAGLLAEAGNEVWAVDLWREHLDAIRDRGLRIEGASGDRTVRSLNVTDSKRWDRSVKSGHVDLQYKRFVRRCYKSMLNTIWNNG